MHVEIRPMDEAAIGQWLDRARAAYVADLIASGIGQAAASRTAAEQEAAAFPDGRPANGHVLFDVVVGGDEVGHLWIGPSAPTTTITGGYGTSKSTRRGVGVAWAEQRWSSPSVRPGVAAALRSA